MPSLLHSRRRDPRWEEDGPRARREHRVRRLRELAAFGTSLLAAIAAGGFWVLRVGGIIGRG